VANYQFPRDEFDDYEARPTPVGVHRAPRSRWSRLWPFLLVAALAGSIGVVGIWSLTRAQDITGPQEAPPAIIEPTPGTDDDNGEDAYEPGDPGYENGDEYQQVEANVNYEVSIRVLNDTGPAGEAGRGRDRLTEHGFTNVVADNFPGDSGLTASTVWYTGDNHDSALAVAEALGIPADRVTEHAVTGAEIAVIVRGSLGL